MDFDGDGRLDIVAATFDGSPHVALGGEQGFAQPEQILDGEGRRIVLNQFWNYETEEWDTTRRCDAASETARWREASGGVFSVGSGGSFPEAHCTSAVALDWDADGDLDLLLGDYKSGRIYRRANEGKPGAPRFAGVNEPVMLGAEPLAIPGRIESLRVVDWDADGRTDLLCGGVEAKSPRADPTGVFWVRDAGPRGEPRFEAPRLLVAASRELPPPPAQPFGGFYADAGDVDGDGDLDLVVGAKGHWDEPARPLTEEQIARLAQLDEELEGLRRAIDAAYQAMEDELAELDEDSAEAEAVAEEFQTKFRPLHERSNVLTEERDGLTFGRKEGYFVWLYERLGP